MFGYKIEMLTASVTYICDPTGAGCFLVSGNDCAALLDTGTGLGDLRAEVGKLTELPVLIILTHGHGDHAGGASQFERVYINQTDVSLALRHCTVESRIDYARFCLPHSQINELDLSPAYIGSFLPLADGQVFDLGGITLEMIAVPGHTKGTMCILLREERAILFGDACNANTFLFDGDSCSVTEYLNSLRRLKSRETEYGTVYFSHGPVTGPKSCVTDNIELCERILEGTDDAVPFNFLGQAAWQAAKADENYRRLDGKYGNIIYNKNNL